MKITNDIFCVMNETGDFVDYLWQVMKDRELEPADITRLGGLSPSQVSKVLNRESPAGQKALESFAKAFNLPYEDLYRRSRNMKPNDDETVTELTHIYHKLNDDNKQDVLDYARLRQSKQEREHGGKR